MASDVHFPKAEFDRRLEAVKRRMESEGIEVLLITSPANMYYVTGYDGWSFYTPQVAVVALDRDEPVWIGREMDAACAEYTTLLRPESIVGYPDHYVDSATLHEMDFVADYLRRTGLGSRRMGIELESYYFSGRAYRRLIDALPDAKVKDTSRLVNWIRSVKSDQEVAYMRQAGLIVEHAMDVALEAVTPGMRQCDLAATIVEAQISGTAAFGGGAPPGIFIGVGERARAPHLKWTDEPLRAGQTIALELGACRHRYHAAMARTICLGDVPPDLGRLAGIVDEGMETALDAVRPGTTCEAIEAAWRKVINREGYEKTSRIGYSIGIAYTPAWIEQTASLRAGDRTELVPNMTFHMILGMWQEPVTCVSSQTFLVTPTGCERLTKTPPALVAIH